MLGYAEKFEYQDCIASCKQVQGVVCFVLIVDKTKTKEKPIVIKQLPDLNILKSARIRQINDQ